MRYRLLLSFVNKEDSDDDYYDDYDKGLFPF